jgi:hypothetical protein
MPQVGSNIVGDAELGCDTGRGFGMLGPTKVTVNRLHVANGKVDHLLEDFWIIEFGIFAIQFRCHGIVLKKPAGPARRADHITTFFTTILVAYIIVRAGQTQSELMDRAAPKVKREDWMFPCFFDRISSVKLSFWAKLARGSVRN